MFYSNLSAAFTVSIDGGSAVTVTPAGGGAVASYTVTGLADTSHTVVVNPSAANVFLLGFRVRRASGVEFSNMGVKYGITATGWDADTSQVSVRFLTTSAITAPDVLHLALGANDMGNDVAVAATTAALSNIRGLYPDADCILYLQPQYPGKSWDAYAAAMYALADTLDCPLVDLSGRFGDAATMLAGGLIGADDLHLNALAEKDWGNLAFDGVRRVTAANLAPKLWTGSQAQYDALGTYSDTTVYVVTA